MSEKPKSKAKKPVVYRKRHKSLVQLTVNNTKHAFEERLHGALQRQESEPAYFGVSDMSAQEDHSELGIFETATQHNYQEAAKQRATRSRLTASKHRGHRLSTRRLRSDQSRFPEQIHQAGRSRETDPRERTRADSLPEGCQEPSKGIQREGLPDARSTHFLSIPSQLNPLIVSDAKQSFHPFPTPCSTTSPHTPLSFTFAGLTEVPTLPSMAFVADNGISSGLGTGSINQSFDQAQLQPLIDFQEACRGQFHPYSNIHSLTLPLYDLPAEVYQFNQQFPFTNNDSPHHTDPNSDWFSG